MPPKTRTTRVAQRHAPSPPPVSGKLVAPRGDGMLPRERLLALLDDATRRPLTWIAAPAGSGKTMAVAGWLAARRRPVLWYQVDADDRDLSNLVFHLREAAERLAPRGCAKLPLLTPEYLAGVAPFVRRFFAQLANCLPPGTVLVFDNCQEAGPDAALHGALAEGLRGATGLSCVLLSRGEPPPDYARLRAERGVSQIGEEPLRFTQEEIGLLVHERTGISPAPADVTALQTRTLGWAAGLSLLLDANVHAGPNETARADNAQATFDYFATELFARLDADTRQLLLRTAMLPTVSVSAAAALAGAPRAAAQFDALGRDHGFVYRLAGTPVRYQLHPLFRHYLLSRAEQEFPSADQQALQRDAAAVLHAEGQLEEAAHLHISTADWAGLTELILKEAQALLAQGRHGTLNGWLYALPHGALETNAWLSFYLGLCEMLADPGAARVTLGKAYEQFRGAGDLVGQVLAWAGIVDSVALFWGDFSLLNPWVARAEQELAPHYEALPPGLARQRLASGMHNALMYWATDHPDIELWAGRVWDHVLETDNPNQRILLAANLLMYRDSWRGEHGPARQLLDAVRPDTPELLAPLARILWHFMQGVHLMFRNRMADTMREVNAGLAVAERTAVVLQNTLLHFLATYACLGDGDTEGARAHLDATKPFITPRRPFEYTHYQMLRASLVVAEGNLGEGVALSREVMLAGNRHGGLYHHANGRLQLVEALRASGEHAEAGRLATEALAIGQRIGSATVEYHARLLLADCALARGDTTAADDQLSTAFALARQRQLINTNLMQGPMLARCLARALEAGIETGTVRERVQIHRGILPESPDYPESWPWRLHVYALGRFELFLDNQPLRLEGKGQRKPLELLKALVAFGGRDVREERLTEALWPDADGDAGHSSFTTTLSRLRKLIGDDTLILSGGRLSLAPRDCWLDVWAFEALLAGAEQPGTVAEPAVAQRALALYRGPFLRDECEEPWALSLRERLNARFVRCLTTQARRLGEAGRWEEAAALYQRGIEADPHIEQLHRGLMTALHHLGCRAEALSAFERLRALLKRTFDIEPAPETHTLAESIRAGG